MIGSVITLKNKDIVVNESEVDNVDVKFKPGIYQAHTVESGIIIKKREINEVHLPFESTETIQVLNTIELFFKPEMCKKINDLGFIHKLGVLLYGIQGTGKTALINYISNTMVSSHNGIVMICSNGNELLTATSLARSIRFIQNEPIIFICDEFERFARDEEAAMKNILDGKDSINNSLFLATTNYIEQVPKTIKDRPSRISVLLEMKGITDKRIMKSVIKNISDKINPGLFSDKEIENEIKDLNSATVDELKHICLRKATDSFINTSSNKQIGFKYQSNNDDDDEPIKEFKGITWNSFYRSVKKITPKII